MSREIDERLVAMRFDNQQFEEGVKESLASLAALREGLDLDGAADSFNEVSKASEKYLQFKEPVQAAANLQNSLSKIGSVAKAAFNGMTAPIKAVGNAINGVYKDISRLFGLDIAYNLEQSAIKTVRAFTTDPLTTGFQEYETKVDALRAIMSSTVEAYTKKMGGIYDEDMHRSEVEKKIEDLNRYADQTIYSFSDMMRALPTLTNMGVDLDDAVSTVKGLHNLAALAGKGAAEASRALFNLGDAFSMGHFEPKDWKTMEYAGIATPDFKKIAIQVASKNGALIAKSGKYYAKEVTEKGIEKLHEVTVENFKDTLRYDWFDKKTIEETFKIFSGELTELDLLSRGYDATADREIIDWFLKIGKEANTAASEVRTFSKMMDALKEAAQSGWATSYEYIFGSDKDATAFWSPISAAISNVLDESAKARNEALRGWSESVVNIDGTVKKTRDAVKDAIIQLVQVFATVKNAVSDAWSTIFGKFDKKRLTDITKGFAKFASSLQKWLGDKSIKGSRINKISSALEGFFSILHAVFGTVKDVFGWVGEKISPVFDWLFDKITSFGALLQEKFKGTKNLKEVFDVIKNSSSGNVRQALNWLADVPEKISSKWDEIKNWYNSSSLKGIVTSVWDGIINFFTAPEGKTSTFDSLLGWLKQAYTDLSTTWNEVKTWYEGSTLKEIVDNVWDGIAGFFFPKVIAGKQGNSWTETESGFAQAISWFSGAFLDISTTWESIKTWYNNSKLKEVVDNVWDGIVSFFTPKTKTILGKQGNSWTETESPFTSLISTMAGWIDEAKKTIGNMWDELHGWWTSDDNPIRNVTDSIWSGILGFFKAPEGSEDGKSGFDKTVEWLVGAYETISAKWNEILEWWNNPDNKLHSTVDNIWSGILGFFKAPEGSEDGKSGFNKTVEWLIGAYKTISEKWNEILEWWNNPDNKLHSTVDNIWSGILGFFKAPEGSEDGKSGFNKTVEWLVGAYKTISAKWSEILEWWNNPDNKLHSTVDNIWSGILGFFKAPEGSEDGKSGFDKTVEWLVGAYETISAKWNEILEWWNNPDNKLHSTVDNIWSGILGFFKAPEGSEDGKSGFNKTVEWLVGAYETISAKWNEILEWWNNPDNKLHSTVDNIWSGILSFFTVSDTSFLSSISEFISELWKTISGLFFPENLADETKSAHEAISELGGIFTASASLTDASSGKKEIKKTFFDGILEYIEGLKQKFEDLNIREFLSDLLGTVADFFTPQTVIGKQGNTWQTSPFIRLSDSISEGWEEFKAYPIWADIGAFLGNTWGWISSLFTEKVTVEKDDGTQEVHSKIGAKLDEIKSGIEKIFDTFKTSAIWQNIGELIKDPWGWIKKIAGIATEKVAGAVESVKSAIDSNPALNTIATFISTVFTSLKELIAEANGSELGQNFVSSLSSFFDAIGNFFKMAGDLLNIVLKDVSVVNRQYLWFAITKTILNISSALKDWKKSILTINRDSVGDAFIKFSASILMVSLAISTLGKMPIGQLAQGILAVGAVTVAITSIASAFKKIETGDSVKEMLKSGAVYLGGKLIDALGSMLTVVWTVSLVINNIDSILSSISKYKFESGKFLEVITGILEIAFGAALLAAMVSKFQFTPQTLANVGYVIGSIAIALLGFLLMIAVIGNAIALDKEGFDRNVENFLLLFDALGRIVGAIIGGYTTEKMKGTANGISQAANIISQIPFDELELFFYAFGRLADIMDEVPDYTVFQKLFDTDGLSMLSEGMPKLAQGFKDFAGIASEVTDVSNVDKAVDFITKMAEATKTLAMADYIAFGYQGLNTRGLNSTDLMIDHFNDVLEFLGEAKLKSNGGYNFEGFFGQVGQLAKKINAGIEEAALGISADPIILGIAKGLLQSSGELTPAITQAIKDVYSGLNQIDSSVTSTGSTFVTDLFSQTEGLKKGSIPQFDSLFSVTDLQQSLNTVSTSLDFSGLEQTLGTNASEMSSILEGAFTLDGVNFGDDASSELEASWSSLFDTLTIEVNSKSEALGENMAGALVAGFRSKAEELSLAISENIDTAPVITPVLDLGQFKRDAFGMRNLLPGTLSLNLAGAAVAPQDTSALSLEVLNRMADQNAAALTAMGQIMSDGLSYIGSMIGNIKFEMDGMAVGKAVFPYVDAELAKNLARYLRNNNKLRK